MTCQLNVEVVAVTPEASVAVTVTELAEVAVLAEPLITPVLELIESPEGRPAAEYVYGEVPLAAVTVTLAAARLT